MKGFFAVFKRELFSLFVTPTAWILIAVGVACVIAWLAGLAHLWTK